MEQRLELEVAHAVFMVRDMALMTDFYERVLGFEIVDRGPAPIGEDAEIVFLSQSPTCHHQLAFLGGRADGGEGNALNHLAFRSSATLDELRSLARRLGEEPSVGTVMPLTHGNAWSVYFTDPEGNMLEIYVDSPWHVAQPQGRPFDLELSDDEVLVTTEREFAGEPEFGSLEDYYRRRAEHLAQR